MFNRRPSYHILGDPDDEQIRAVDWDEKVTESVCSFHPNPITKERHAQIGFGARDYYVIPGEKGTRHFIPAESSASTPLPPLDLESDHCFRLGNGFSALIHETASGPQEYLVHLFRSETLPVSFAWIQDWIREEALRKLNQRFKRAGKTNPASIDEQDYMTMLREAPRNSNYLAMVEPWSAARLYPQLHGESDEHYESRLAQVPSPLVALKTAQHVEKESDSPLYAMRPTYYFRGIDTEPMLLFLAAYEKMSDSEKKTVHDVIGNPMGNELLGVDFVTCFSACELDADAGHKLVTLAKTRRDFEDVIFELYKILEWRKGLAQRDDFGNIRHGSEIGSALEKPIENYTALSKGEKENVRDAQSERAKALRAALVKMDPVFTYTFVAKKIRRFIDDALGGMPLEKLQKLYDPPTLIKGAVLNAIVEESADSPTKVGEQLSSLFDDLEISHELTGPDAGAIIECLERAYRKSDPGWCDYLIRGVARDRKNPQVDFNLLKNDGVLWSGCKTRPATDEEKEGVDAKNVVYFGTHYTTLDAPKHFNGGEVVQRMAQAQLDKDTAMVLTVSATNTALERQIGLHGIGIGITHEGDEISRSKELIKGVWNYRGTFMTKNREAYSDDYFKACATDEGAHMDFENGNEAVAYRANSTDGHNAGFLKICAEQFKAGYVMTRIFYERNDAGAADQRLTYVVFEKDVQPTHHQSQPSDTEH